MTDATPLSPSIPADAFDALAAEMAAEIERGREASIVKPRYSTPISPMKSEGYDDRGRGRLPSGGVVEGRPQFFSGPPLTGQTSGPLALLSTVADHSKQLHLAVKELLKALTGEVPADRPVAHLAQVGIVPGALPRVAQLATEIDVVHTDIARLIEHMRRAL